MRSERDDRERWRFSVDDLRTGRAAIAIFLLAGACTGAGAAAIDGDSGPDGSFNRSFQSKWGYGFDGRVRDASGADGHAAWVRDIQRMIAALQVVINNGPSSIGGGGDPLQPLAPPLP